MNKAMEKIKDIARAKTKDELLISIRNVCRNTSNCYKESIIEKGHWLRDYLESLWRNLVEISSRHFTCKSVDTIFTSKRYGDRTYHICTGGNGYYIYPSKQTPIFVRRLPESFDTLVAAYEDIASEAETFINELKLQAMSIVRANRIATVTLMSIIGDMLDDTGLEFSVIDHTGGEFVCCIAARYHIPGLPLRFKSSVESIREDLSKVLEKHRDVFAQAG
jgi:hypothetical protein